MLGALFALLMTIGVFVVLPLLLVGLVLRIAVGLVVLPFKLLGALLRVVLGAVGAVVGVVASGFGILFALGLGLLFLVALPLLPLLILAGLVWAVVKLFSAAATAVA